MDRADEPFDEAVGRLLSRPLLGESDRRPLESFQSLDRTRHHFVRPEKEGNLNDTGEENGYVILFRLTALSFNRFIGKMIRKVMNPFLLY